MRIVSDFDGNDQTDYALLVDDRKSRVSIIVFLRMDSGFIHKVLLNRDYYQYFNPKKIEVVMTPVTGKIEALDEIIHLENMGIGVTWIMSPTSAVYYWKESDFVEAWISD